MNLLPFIFRKHTPPKKIEVGDAEFEGGIGEALSTPVGEMAGVMYYLPTNIPNIMLFPKHNAVWYAANSFKINRGQSLKLEGDFNKYFEVYSIPGSEVFALDILSPEFMQSLLAMGNKFIVVFGVNEVYVLLQTAQSLTPILEKELLQAANALANAFSKKLLNWSDQDAQDSSKKMLDYSQDDAVRLKGHQLDYRAYVGLCFAIFFNILIWGIYFTSSDPRTLASFAKTLGISLAILVGFPLYTRYLMRK